MPNQLCDGEIRKNFRVVANIIVIGIILSSIGIGISIFVLVNLNLNIHLFPFSWLTDPPYLGIISGIILAFFIMLAIYMHRIKKKTCESLALPLI